MDGIALTVDQQVVTAMETSRSSLERYVRSLVRDPDEAADIIQETHVRLLVVARSEGLPACPTAWMTRVAHNLVVSNARRRQTAERGADRLVDADLARSIEDEVVVRERDADLVRALATARSVDREAIVLAATGYRTREIAERLGRSELATRALLCRARGRMRQSLLAPELA